MWKQNGVDKQCIICGRTLIDVAPGTKYCPECRKTVYKSAHNGDRKRKKQGRGLAADAKRAMEVGMTYGEYMARQGYGKTVQHTVTGKKIRGHGGS